jgi:sugar/nucleoside kinase (ribokinase family)
VKKRNAELEVTTESEATSWKHDEWMWKFLKLVLILKRSEEEMDKKNENSSMKKLLPSVFDSLRNPWTLHLSRNQ